jgi:hypothetical protein
MASRAGGEPGGSGDSALLRPKIAAVQTHAAKGFLLRTVRKNTGVGFAPDGASGS